MKGFFVTGTDTGVGKTEIASCLARMFSRRGLKVGVMKPVATGVGKTCRDARILKRSSGSPHSTDWINPVSLKLPIAPLVAQDIEKNKIDMKVIWDRFRRLKTENDVVIVEGIGGTMVPMCRIGKKIFYVLDMILKMKLPVIIVARPNLGTINHTLLTIRTLQSKKIKIAGIIFSHTSKIKNDLSIRTNPTVIERLSGVKALGIMHYEKIRNKRRIKWLKAIEL